MWGNATVTSLRTQVDEARLTHEAGPDGLSPVEDDDGRELSNASSVFEIRLLLYIGAPATHSLRDCLAADSASFLSLPFFVFASLSEAR